MKSCFLEMRLRRRQISLNYVWWDVFFQKKNLNIKVMKAKLADIWRPVRGINIKDLKPGIFLFQFYHIDDM